jgi:hypothetical protein|nr:MAG TPA: hypothetical protein [Caudoviricetes sp.]
MKKYFKENQVYSVQEGSVLEAQLISNDFEEVVETESQLKGKKADDE